MPGQSALTAGAFVAMLVAGSAVSSGQGQITNGRVETVAVRGDLAPAIAALAGRAEEPFWIGYAMPAADGRRTMCCFSSTTFDGEVRITSGSDGACAGCRLEPGDGAAATGKTASEPVRLEGATDFVVMARVGGGAVEKIRAFSRDCPLDAGGRTVFWLSGVTPAVSVAWLAGFATETDGRAGAAIGAIALHRDEGADRALERLVKAGQPEKIREKAAFWMGVARGRRGFETLRQLVTTDGNEDFRRRAIMAVSETDQPETVEVLVDRARADASVRVRGEALFWLAQKAGKRAAGAITDAIANDPDTAVKKRAVFALSQLPKDEGVPRLIEVARSNRNPEVRKQAMFWLGQSRDPRALQFFEEILGK